MESRVCLSIKVVSDITWENDNVLKIIRINIHPVMFLTINMCLLNELKKVLYKLKFYNVLFNSHFIFIKNLINGKLNTIDLKEKQKTVIKLHAGLFLKYFYTK